MNEAIRRLIKIVALQNCRFTWPSGHGAALSLIVVRTGLPRITLCKPRSSIPYLKGADNIASTGAIAPGGRKRARPIGRR